MIIRSTERAKRNTGGAKKSTERELMAGISTKWLYSKRSYLIKQDNFDTVSKSSDGPEFILCSRKQHQTTHKM